MTITEAHARMARLLPKQTFSIDYECWDHRKGDGPEVTWSLWDGYNCHTGATLADAVAVFELAHAKRPAADLEADYALLQGMEAAQ